MRKGRRVIRLGARETGYGLRVTGLGYPRYPEKRGKNVIKCASRLSVGDLNIERVLEVQLTELGNLNQTPWENERRLHLRPIESRLKSTREGMSFFGTCVDWRDGATKRSLGVTLPRRAAYGLATLRTSLL